MDFSYLRSLRRQIVDVPRLDENNDICRPCKYKKALNSPFHVSTGKAKEIVDTIHLDIVGPVGQSYLDRFRCFLTLVNDYFRYELVKVTRKTSDSNKDFKMFLKQFSPVTNEKSAFLQAENYEKLYEDALNFHSNILF